MLTELCSASSPSAVDEPGKSPAAPSGVNALLRSTRMPARPSVLVATKPAHGNAEAETRNVSGAIVEAPSRPHFVSDCQIARPASCGAQ